MKKLLHESLTVWSMAGAVLFALYQLVLGNITLDQFFYILFGAGGIFGIRRALP